MTSIQLSVPNPQSPIQSGQYIKTASGIARVTSVGQLGDAQIIEAVYGPGYPQVHIPEAIEEFGNTENLEATDGWLNRPTLDTAYQVAVQLSPSDRRKLIQMLLTLQKQQPGTGDIPSSLPVPENRNFRPAGWVENKGGEEPEYYFCYSYRKDGKTRTKTKKLKSVAAQTIARKLVAARVPADRTWAILDKYQSACQDEALILTEALVNINALQEILKAIEFDEQFKLL